MENPVNEQHSVEQSVTPQPQTLTTNNHSWFKTLSIGFSIVSFCIAIGIGGYMFLQVKKTQDGKQQSQSVIQNPKQKPISAISLLPKLAYRDRYTIHILNTDGSEKKQLIKLDETMFRKNYPQIQFSPLSNEILINTDNTLLGINIQTGVKRQIYNHGVSNYNLLEDAHTLCISNSTLVDIQNLSVKRSQDDCGDIAQRYYDKKSNIKISTNAKDVLEGGAGRHILSTQITVEHLDTHSQQTFLFKKEGDVFPLFIANNFFYFYTQQCCAAGDSLDGLQQMNLTTGEFSSSITSAPEMEANIYKSGAKWAFASATGLYKNHFIYYTAFPESQYEKVYEHDIFTNKDILIKTFSSANIVNLPIFSSWSSDGNWMLFKLVKTTDTSVLNDFYLYNFLTKELKEFSLPNQNYILLK